MTPVEVITSVQRRRRWSAAEKQQIVAESALPDRTVSQVARAHGIAPSQLFTWRRQLLAAAVAEGVSDSGFVPVRVAPDASPPEPMPLKAAEPCLEIVLPSGIRIRVGNGIEIETLRRVLAALTAR
jgi:transposase